MRELAQWLAGDRDPDAFPYTAVVAAFHRTGKHFVADDLLALLDRIRADLTSGPTAGARPLRDFLDVALDKRDGRYDYQTYLALDLLPMPAGDATDDLRRRHDRLFTQLIGDALAFELATEAGTTELLPRERPAPALVAKRYRLGIRAVSSALTRLGHTAVPGDDLPAAGDDLPGAVAAVLATVAADQSGAERHALAVSMLPVYLLHDEYLFIRVLQAYECTFALLASELRATVDDLAGGRPRTAAGRLAYAHDLLGDAAPLFSLMASMQPESFRAFRVYTEGASAIQSRAYKLVEALCRRPDQARLSSAAYGSVPDVRERVLAGLPSIDQARHAASRAGLLAGPDRGLLETRMDEFAAALVQWRRTHYRIATRMLGDSPGTGYTEGTPYLAAARSIPVFAVTDEEGDAR